MTETQRPNGTPKKIGAKTPVDMNVLRLLTVISLSALAGFSVGGSYVMLHVHADLPGHPGIVQEFKEFRGDYAAGRDADRAERFALRLTLERLNTTLEITNGKK